jgi:hypothetical protein
MHRLQGEGKCQEMKGVKKINRRDTKRGGDKVNEAERVRRGTKLQSGTCKDAGLAWT